MAYLQGFCVTKASDCSSLFSRTMGLKLIHVVLQELLHPSRFVVLGF